jgi:hypothetical protein
VPAARIVRGMPRGRGSPMVPSAPWCA